MADNKSRIRQIYIDKDGNIIGRKNSVKKDDVKKKEAESKETAVKDVEALEEISPERIVIDEKELKHRIARHKMHRVIRIAALVITLVLLLVIATAAGSGLALMDIERTPSELAKAIKGEVVLADTIETISTEDDFDDDIEDGDSKEDAASKSSERIDESEADDIQNLAEVTDNDKLKSLSKELEQSQGGYDTIGKTLSKNVKKVDALTGEAVKFLEKAETSNEDSKEADSKEESDELDEVPYNESAEISGIATIKNANEQQSNSDISQNAISAKLAMNSPDYYYPLPFTRVDEDYFSDALFIGDSRMLGFGMWSHLPATYYCLTGFQLYNYETAKVVQTENGKVPIFDAIPYDAFSKIYIKVGLNEMGWGKNGAFEEKYAEFISRLREVEPRAIVFVQAILPVTQAKSSSSAAHNKKNIDDRNEKLKAFSKEVNAYYIDAGPYLCDEEGYLRSEMTSDGVHLAAKYMDLWKECFYDHGVVVP